MNPFAFRVSREMSFGDVSSAAGLEKLDAFLLDNSYAGGWVPSQVDVALYKAMKASPDGEWLILHNVSRVHNTITFSKSSLWSVICANNEMFRQSYMHFCRKVIIWFDLLVCLN